MLLFLTLGLLCGGGCGNVPDLKVTANRIPGDTTQLWAIPWQGPSRAVLSEPLIYDLTPSAASGSRDFSFGLKVVEPDLFIVISTAAFKTTAQGFCFRTDGTAVQPGGFGILTTLPVLLDDKLIPEGRAEVCYPTLEKQKWPLVTGLTFQIERISGSTAATGVLFIKGWNFSPTATVRLVVNGEDLTPSDKGEIVQEQPNQIRILIRDEVKILKIQPNFTVTVTVTNPSEMPFMYTTKIVGN